MKKYILIVFTILLAVIFLISALILIPVKINDFSLIGFKNEVIENLQLPQNTSLVGYVSGCGNSSGTGDHTDLYVAVLIYSELDFDTLATHFRSTEHFWRMQNIKEHGDRTIGMQCMGLNFHTIFDKPENYFILEFNKGALLDFRGW